MINQDDREILLNEILKKLISKENFKLYFTEKYSNGSFVEFQNMLINSEQFLYDIGKELFEIENQINSYQFVEENKISYNDLNIKRKIVNNNQKKEEYSKTSQNFSVIKRNIVRSNSNNISKQFSNDNKILKENNYLEPINFEKLLRNNSKTSVNLKKKPFNRFGNTNIIIDKKKKVNELNNKLVDRDYYDNNN